MWCGSRVAERAKKKQPSWCAAKRSTRDCELNLNLLRMSGQMKLRRREKFSFVSRESVDKFGSAVKYTHTHTHTGKRGGGEGNHRHTAVQCENINCSVDIIVELAGFGRNQHENRFSPHFKRNELPKKNANTSHEAFVCVCMSVDGTTYLPALAALCAS